MSMLAEPRRKKKWSVDPRNSAWSNDESKFGQKMMERMGWSKGKGLGRNMQGTTDNIKVKVKNDSLGLGTNVNHEDNWIAHQDEFNQLLADLNNCHGQNDTTSESSPPDEPAPQGFSLEEKSKTSKKRVHYMKFTKGKDLSNRSEADLNSIFGKRSKSATDQQKENNSRDSLEEENKKEKKNGSPTTTSSEHDVESITKTTINTLSMQEYFAQKMAKLKKRARGGEAEVSSSTPEAEETNETPGSSEEVDAAVHANVDCTGEPLKKKKKKKKRNSDVKEEMTETAVAPGIIEGVEDQEGGCSEKKKKKKKRQKAKKEEDAVNGEDCSSTSGLEQNSTEEDLPPAKKKKHKAANKDTDTIDGPTENLNVESEVVHKKKKKKHREQVDSEVLVVAQEEEVEKKSKKHKKEKKNN